MQSFTQSIAVRPALAAPRKQQQGAARVRPAPRSVVTASLKRDDGERKINAAAAIALAAVVPFAACCVGANQAVGAEISDVYGVMNVANTPSQAEPSKLASKVIKSVALGDEPAFDKLKKWTGEEEPGQQLTEKFSKLKAPGLPSGGDILRNAPHVGTNNLPTMPDAAEAIPKAGRNW